MLASSRRRWCKPSASRAARADPAPSKRPRGTKCVRHMNTDHVAGFRTVERPLEMALVRTWNARSLRHFRGLGVPGRGPARLDGSKQFARITWSRTPICAKVLAGSSGYGGNSAIVNPERSQGTSVAPRLGAVLATRSARGFGRGSTSGAMRIDWRRSLQDGAPTRTRVNHFRLTSHTTLESKQL